jgi:hypothetical protein
LYDPKSALRASGDKRFNSVEKVVAEVGDACVARPGVADAISRSLNAANSFTD